MMGNDWMVACMIPKGKMMANMLKMDEKEVGSFTLVKFQSSQKEGTQENKALEEDFLSFMEKGISNIKRDGTSVKLNWKVTINWFVGKSLIITAGGVDKTFTEDDIRARHEEAQKAKQMSMRGSGRY